MLNQTITLNAAPVQGARSDTSNSTAKSTSDAPATGAFGAVLARQIDEKNNAAAQSANASNTSNTSNKSNTAESAKAAKSPADASQPTQDQAVAATTPALAPDAASIVMNSILLGNPGIKASGAGLKGQDKAEALPADTAQAVSPDAAAMVAGMSAKQAIKPSVASTSLKETDKAAANAQAATPDAAAMVAGMFGNQEIKASATTPGLKEKDKATAVTDAKTPDAAAMVAGMFGNPAITPATVNDANGNAGNRPAGSAAIRQADISATGSATGRQTESRAVREDPAMAALSKSDTTVQPALKNLTGAASPKLTELSASPSTAAPSAQVIPQGALIAANLPSNTVTNTTIAAPLGSSAWPAEFAQKISWVSTQQNQVAELHLNPPDLGPMSVVLSVADNQATAVFSSPHSAVREAIENALPKLRESLAENGITLGNTTVSDQAPRDNGASGFMNQRANTRTDSEPDGSINSTTSLPEKATPRHNGLIDTFA